MEVNIGQAKIQFSKLLRRVAAGEEITIARAGVPVARLIPVEKNPRKTRPMGMDRGKVWVADDFDAPLPNDLLAAFYGEVPQKASRSKRKKAAPQGGSLLSKESTL